VIPLEEQLELFDERRDDAWFELVDMVGWDWKEIVALARERLIAGYHTYGDQMFRWGAAERRRNVLEELADALVYLTSGPV